MQHHQGRLRVRHRIQVVQHRHHHRHLYAKNVKNAKYTTSEGESGSFKDGDTIEVGGFIGVGEKVTVTATNEETGEKLKNTYTYTKTEVEAQNLASQYQTKTNATKKTINVDGDLSDWDSSMIIAQGAANDDPRVYHLNSMYAVPIDLYTLYGTYDDENVYLMWEMTNVQDVVAPNDDYPLSQGTMFNNMNVPFFLAFDTGDSSTRIGKSAQLTTGGTLWDTGITWQQKLNKVVAISTNGANGPWVYGGSSDGLNANAQYGPAANAKTETEKSGIQFDYGQGILSTQVSGIDGAYGTNNGRVPGDMKAGSNANWVNFNEKGHNSSTMDFHYEMAIPLSELGTDVATITKSGLGVQLVATMGKSGMDTLPYDLAINDNTDLDDSAGSQENNSFEKSDLDNFIVNFARLGGSEPSGGDDTVKVESVNISGDGVKNGKLTADLADGDTTAQLSATVKPTNATNKKVTWESSNTAAATVDSTGLVTFVKKGTATITATAGGKSATVAVTVTGEKHVAKVTTIFYPSSKFGANSTCLHYRVGANGTWTTAPGVKMAATRDGWVGYTIPDVNEEQVEFVFNDGKGNWDNNGGINKNYTGSGAVLVVQEDGTIGTVSPCVVKVDSLAITGDGVKDGKLSLKVGEDATLKAVVTPDTATDARISWSSSDSSVASVMGTGVVSAKKAGTATITAESGDVKATVKLTVKAAEKQPMTVYYKPASSWKETVVSYRINGKVVHADMTEACGGWMSYEIADTGGNEVKVVFTNGSGKWDSNGKNLLGETNGYKSTGDTLAVSGG